MPYKDPLKQKEAQARYYQESKAKYRERKQKKVNVLRRITQDIKNSTPCMDCGMQYPHYMMDFDHVRGSKRFNISLTRHFTEATLREEIAKCEVVCSNCHRHRTYIRLSKGPEMDGGG